MFSVFVWPAWAREGVLWARVGHYGDVGRGILGPLGPGDDNYVCIYVSYVSRSVGKARAPPVKLWHDQVRHGQNLPNEVIHVLYAIISVHLTFTSCSWCASKSGIVQGTWPGWSGRI